MVFMRGYSTQPKVEYKRKPRAIESGLQQRLVALWRNVAKAEYRDALFAIPNGGMLTPGYRYRLLNEGLIAGWPDLGLALPSGHIAWIECKRPVTLKWSDKTNRMIIADGGGKVDKWQEIVHNMLRGLGHEIIIITDESQLTPWLKQNARDMLKCLN
jgi:hypothetical protein